jgi:tRNA-dihydrouridine synthase B
MLSVFNDISTQLRPLTIGGFMLESLLTLAPMAGQTNHAFRTLCREFGGCGLVCSEVISSTALQYKSSRSRTLDLFDWDGSERPVAAQLFGADPYVMAEAARIVVDAGADIVDINMGCWVPKVAKKGGGAALLRDVCAAVAVVEAVVKAVSVPVTVKVRSGWDAANPTAVPFARAAEDVGAQAIAVHARFADQGFTGQSDWDMIRQVKAALRSIPLIGNGDVTGADDARAMMEATGCDGVMIGRAALGNPWIFRQISYQLATGVPLPDPTPQARKTAALRHARLHLETTRVPPHAAIYELRGQLLKYLEPIPDAGALREALVRARTIGELEAILG